MSECSFNIFIKNLYIAILKLKLNGIIDFSKQLSIYTGNAIYESAKNINQTFMKS